MKKLLLIGALTAALFSCKKEKLFDQGTASSAGKPGGFSTLDSPADQKDRTVLVVLISTLTKQNLRTEEEARKAVFADTGRSLRTFYNETSGNRLFIVGKNDRLLGDVTSITVAEPLLLNQCATATWRTLALPSLLLKLINPATYDEVIYITPLVSGCSNGIGSVGIPGGDNTGQSVVYFDKDGTTPIRQRTLAHETGHNLGLNHANVRTCTDGNGAPVTLSDNFIIGDQKDPSEVMGTSARDEEYGRLLSAPRLKSLGWLTDAEITTTTGVGSFALAPLYGGLSGIKALVIPGFATGYDLWMETRQPFGIHDNFNPNGTYGGSNIPESAVGTLAFRLVKNDASNRVSTELLDMTPTTVGNRGFVDAYLRVGQTFAYGGKSIKLESVAANGVATVKIIGPPPATLVPYGSVWKYLDNGSNQGTAWAASSFNDASWSSGTAQLGYGPSSTSTVVSYGPNASSKYVTTYFRRTFNIDNPAYASITGNVKRDDGVAIYVNGVEVYRNNLAAGAGYLTKALSNASDNGATPQTFTISPSAFVAGNNTIAVEMHQSTSASTDLVFDLEVKGQ
jgi:hypothetical protein